MLTRCPSCQTVFRLRPEQLRARHGEVRCGHCFNPFNALEHLLEGSAGSSPASAPVAAPARTADLEPATPTVEPAVPPPPPAAPSGAVGTPASEAPPAQEPQPPRPSFSDLEFDIPDSVPTVELTLDHDDVPAFVPSAAATPPRTHEVWPDRLEPSTSPQPPGAEPVSTPAADTPGAGDLPETGPRVDFSAMVAAAGNRLSAANAGAPPVFAHDEPAGPANAPTADIRIEPQDAVLPMEPAAPAAFAADGTASRAGTEHLDATYGPARAHGALFSVGVIVLALGLVLQSAYFFRESIARQLPGLRPLYVAACAQLGCDMPLPRDAMLINIDSPDLQSEPGRPGRYILHATIQNRADYPQAWPHLELTLTDANDTPLVRRVLAPADWVAADKRHGEFRARSDATVRLSFDAPEIAPTGYRVYVFYP